MKKQGGQNEKVSFGLLMVLILATSTFAAGTASVTATQKITVLGQQPRYVMTISWTDDNAGTTLAINPATYGITGWYLYSAETNPGAGPPTANYDITLVDVDGVDIAGGTLLNRHTTTTNSSMLGLPLMVSGYTGYIHIHDSSGTAGLRQGQ